MVHRGPLYRLADRSGDARFRWRRKTPVQFLHAVALGLLRRFRVVCLYSTREEPPLLALGFWIVGRSIQPDCLGSFESEYVDQRELVYGQRDYYCGYRFPSAPRTNLDSRGVNYFRRHRQRVVGCHPISTAHFKYHSKGD